jgi:molybdopterin-guanine dinucleotide biosynthesis protein MobB
MIPIVSFVGRSNVGKTTFLEKVISEMSRRGWRIAVIKHDAHSFEIDHEGKDSWRHKHAGAIMTVISSPSKLALVVDTDHDHSLDEIREKHIRNADIIITEGYKREHHPKIEVFRKERHPELLSNSDDNLIAVAGSPDDPPEDIPVFPLNDPGPTCDFLEKRFLKQH